MPPSPPPPLIHLYMPQSMLVTRANLIMCRTSPGRQAGTLTSYYYYYYYYFFLLHLYLHYYY